MLLDTGGVGVLEIAVPPVTSSQSILIIPWWFFSEANRLILKFVCVCKGPRIAKTPLKRSRVEETLLSKPKPQRSRQGGWEWLKDSSLGAEFRQERAY